MMIRKLSILTLLVLASLLAGCATDVANRYYGAEKYPAKDPKEVELLWQRPSREFTVIADFNRAESQRPCAEGRQDWRRRSHHFILGDSMTAASSGRK